MCHFSPLILLVMQISNYWHSWTINCHGVRHWYHNLNFNVLTTVATFCNYYNYILISVFAHYFCYEIQILFYTLYILFSVLSFVIECSPILNLIRKTPRIKMSEKCVWHLITILKWRTELIYGARSPFLSYKSRKRSALVLNFIYSLIICSVDGIWWVCELCCSINIVNYFYAVFL